MHIFQLLIITFTSFIFVTERVKAGEPWAPNRGYSSVNQEKAYNNFYFSSIEGQYSDIETTNMKRRFTILRLRIMRAHGRVIYLAHITIHLFSTILTILRLGLLRLMRFDPIFNISLI